jgi:hypothetical protein
MEVVFGLVALFTILLFIAGIMVTVGTHHVLLVFGALLLNLAWLAKTNPQATSHAPEASALMIVVSFILLFTWLVKEARLNYVKES